MFLCNVLKTDYSSVTTVIKCSRVFDNISISFTTGASDCNVLVSMFKIFWHVTLYYVVFLK